MPNIKSAIKRTRVIEKKTSRNNMIKSEYKTAVKNLKLLLLLEMLKKLQHYTAKLQKK